jgi:hypothetical protein
VADNLLLVPPSEPGPQHATRWHERLGGLLKYYRRTA